MRGASIWPWGLTSTLLASTYLHALCASASPSVNVELKTSFSSAPYLLELLETAADENSTSYFPLLDRIADGYFSKASTDQELYHKFIQVLKDDGHMPDSETLSSFSFALSMRASAPRIEAHYQYYHTAAEPSLQAEQDTSCPVWVLFNGKQYCSPALDTAHGAIAGDMQLQVLQFDRVLGDPAAPASILYADITSPNFGKFHKTLSKTAQEGKTSYRLRHRKSLTAKSTPLIIPGYGVELALKRTDYIVIDDREDGAESIDAPAKKEEAVKFEDEEIADLKPLSTSEVFSLGLKASSFIMQGESPFDTLVKLSQDFPKYSSAVASHNATKEFMDEHKWNREQMVPAGMNIIWMNGVQMIERQIQALDLLDLLRKERKLISGVRDLGLTPLEAVQLLSHDAVARLKANGEVQRYDWRDDIEGGNAIIWMNNIEKDKRYQSWPSPLAAFLQRTYPGQLPQVRRDLSNLVLVVDFTNAEDVLLVIETLASFVKRALAIRIGLVPLANSKNSIDQSRIIYHLIDAYGLQAALAYLEAAYAAKKLFVPSQLSYDAVITDRKLRVDKIALSFDQVLELTSHQNSIEASQKWAKRLSADGEISPVFANGVAFPRDENWLQAMSQRVSADLQLVQQAIYQDTFEPEDWLPEYFLAQAATRRNSLIVPESDKSLKIFDMTKILGDDQEILKKFPRISAGVDAVKSDWAHAIIVVDLESELGAQLLVTAAVFREANPSVEMIIIHNPVSDDIVTSLSVDIAAHMATNSGKALESIDELTKIMNAADSSRDAKTREDAILYWQSAHKIVDALSLLPGQHAIVLNGRLVGPIPSDLAFELDDLESLLAYERASRIVPTFTALENLGLSDKIITPLQLAKVSSIVAISTISDTPDGIFEQASTVRMNQFDAWNTTYTAIESGDLKEASVQFTVLLNPASHQGQRWVPILKVLSELDGVYVKIFLNPKERLQELPVKRFYRYVLDSKPTFDDAGAVKSLGASFKGLPQEALLNLGMDIPPAWLVAPKVSVHDPDNIKLSSVKGDVNALYELEHILIEGHSREMPGVAAPRGAQLVLGTERDPHFADTLIMANLGYFQFKANPGFYKINLQQGRSAEIFKIDSVGAQGWSPAPGDENTEVVLMSFKGTTLYPRLSRRDGMESEDVLEAKQESDDLKSRGLNFMQGILSKGKAKLAPKKDAHVHADINIFSVASGHLYERMLNIMMVSVMKHTKQTVKFWFIEQFLSPSFKDFIPYLAAEYGFEYEMVTYKWPHWLRAQTEKQREIWGYKILFLDVLFPLSLDKVIFVDADQIVRTDMMELVNHDLQGAPYGFTPMCDSRTEMEGFRFWKQGYWKNFLRGLPYHISALYVVDLRRFRQIAAGDRLRQQYHALSADPGSLSNLDQDLPNHMQSMLPIHSLPQEWLWCETWCSDEALKEAKTIDLCNNPLTKEPKLDRARRQVPEWTVYDDEIAAVGRKRRGLGAEEKNTKSRTLEVVETATKKDEL